MAAAAVLSPTTEVDYFLRVCRMATLLQTLLIETLPEDCDPILSRYFETILPAMEREFGGISALGGAEYFHYEMLVKQGDSYADDKSKQWSQKPDQNLCVHVLNALLIGWTLAERNNIVLSDIEKCLFCLGITLHDYNKYCNGDGEAAPKAYEIPEILALCEAMGETLNFSEFWQDWKSYLSDIGFLAQNTQFKCGTNPIPDNWPTFKVADSRRLKHPLRHLLGFGDIAVHLNDPGDIITEKGGDRLREHLKFLGISKTLVYHRLRDTLGILTNGIHNATIYYTEQLDWQPLIYFAQGVVYLAPKKYESPDRASLNNFIWEQISALLSDRMGGGEIGFKRDGKGLKISPQTSELLPSSQLILQLPNVIESQVKNAKNPATPKRLDKLLDNGKLTQSEREELQRGADLRSDRIAELILLVQREFFPQCEAFVPWILEALEVGDRLTPEDIQIVIGGVNYGWYRAAALWVANHATFDDHQVIEFMGKLAENLVEWAEENQLFPEHDSPTRSVFEDYLNSYLDVSGWETQLPDFAQELDTYTKAKTKSAKHPICSLSGGEFPSEKQLDSVVLFKPQQYSNKNPLGGRQIKRGISKIWALEMLLRQALWSARAGKFEESHPVFLYIFPAYVYAPQVAQAIRRLVEQFKSINLWDIRKVWLEGGMNFEGLQNPQLLLEKPEAGRTAKPRYSSPDLPFMATLYTTTRGSTVTEAWIQPAFLAIALSRLLGVRVVATASNVPLYDGDREFLASVVLDGPAGFWSLLHCPTSVRVQELDGVLARLLVAYSLHLDNRSNPPDARWQAFNGTVREVMTDVLNLFAIAAEGLRRHKREPYPDEVKRYWNFAQIWSKGNTNMEEKLQLISRIVEDYRSFYRVNVSDSSHAILLPLSKTLETILSVPVQVETEDLILQAAGQLKDAIDRQPPYTRPILMDKSLDIATRQERELRAIHQFVKTCVEDLFGGLYRGDRALLQENRNRIKSGAEFAYRWLALQEKTAATQPTVK